LTQWGSETPHTVEPHLTGAKAPFGPLGSSLLVGFNAGVQSLVVNESRKSFPSSLLDSTNRSMHCAQHNKSASHEVVDCVLEFTSANELDAAWLRFNPQAKLTKETTTPPTESQHITTAAVDTSSLDNSPPEQGQQSHTPNPWSPHLSLSCSVIPVVSRPRFGCLGLPRGA
jgi:hypothetical protein